MKGFAKQGCKLERDNERRDQLGKPFARCKQRRTQLRCLLLETRNEQENRNAGCSKRKDRKSPRKPKLRSGKAAGVFRGLLSEGSRMIVLVGCLQRCPPFASAA